MEAQNWCDFGNAQEGAASRERMCCAVVILRYFNRNQDSALCDGHKDAGLCSVPDTVTVRRQLGCFQHKETAGGSDQ